ncbi:MAG: prepilin-type N-terminal cleavage/methylation domain-containing protein [Kiritimatiellae bacterium]|nr:prepilin-type N-terminal cleavage/methylation domain-containing protein [Kiritimatiellia bacterium]
MMRRSRNAAFTLVELLVAMAVLAIIILMMARIFSESTRAFDLGSKIADQNLKGRMVLDFMAREISQAVADDVIAFKLDSADFELFGNAVEDGDRLQFVTLSQLVDVYTPRQAREVVYFVDHIKIDNKETGRYQLKRAVKTTGITCYNQPSPNKWWDDSAGNALTLAENVAGFQVWCYTEPGAEAEAIYDYDSTGSKPEQINKLPMWIEISLMMFDQKDAERAANMSEFGMSAGAVHEYAVKNARRYVTRINFVNRNGYAADK